jgi:cytochrome c551/c552
MKNIVVYLLFVIAVIALYGFAYSIPAVDAPGKNIFVDNKCTMCHSVEVAEVTSKKNDAKDLSNLSADLTSDFLTKYLKKEESLEGKKHKTAFKGSDEELQQMVDWLLTFKVKETEN